jgi:hypothetical protein
MLSPLPQVLESAEDPVGAWVHAHGRDVAPLHDAVRIDHIQGPLARTVFVAVGVIRPGDVALGLEVGKQREMQVPILGEGEMTPDPVHRDAHELRIELLELGEQLLVQGKLIGADRAPVLRVEGEDHGPAPEVRKRHRLVGGRAKLELRGLGPGG